MEKVILIKSKEELKVSKLKRGEVHRLYILMSDNAMGVPWRVPIVVIRGENKGPVVGITAAVHGDELNGIKTIFRLIESVSPKKLSGTLILVPVSNVPGYLKNQRFYSDNVDLNRIFPGAPSGASSRIYAHHFVSRIVSQFDYLLDIHTASHGRVNSLYVRADLASEDTRTLAYLQNPQIIVKKYDEEGTLRAWASSQNIPAITIEVGNPNAFQNTLIDETLEGILNTLRHLKMVKGKVKNLMIDSTICDHSYWIYSKKGGIVDVFPNLADEVKAGEVIATVCDLFGQVREEVIADRSGVVIGKNISPNAAAGTRILHLGVNIIDPMPSNIPGHELFSED